MALADSSDDAGRAWEKISVGILCRWTCLSKPSVLRSLQWLEGEGLINVTRAGIGKRNQTWIALARVAELNQSQGDTGVTVTPVSQGAPSGLRVIPEPVSPRDPITQVHIPISKQREQRSRPKRPIPGDWTPDKDLTAWAQEKQPGLDLPSVVERFRDYHLAKGEARASWDASFRMWVSKERQFATTGKRRPTSHTGFAEKNYLEGIGPNGELL